ncbi:helix-turn-helix domain-containing protein [Candidatus Woesearchaeota archaeon]|nr:helix-turn-helix domain-containing protein [Candidatus Woesearchaeota archaeon]
MSKESILKDLGLSDKEIKVYLTLLSVGQSTVNKIALKSKLNRVTCYDVLNYLKDKGLVSYVIKSGVKYFEASEPQKLLGDLQEKEDKLKSILPELELLKKSVKQKPSIELYEGLAGLKTVVEDVLKENKECWFLVAPNFIDELQYYFPHFITKKRKQGMFSKVIAEHCERMRDYKKNNPKRFIDMRLVKAKFPTTKIIYGDKVAILTFEKDNSIGIIMENKAIAETERKQFNLLWGIAK